MARFTEAVDDLLFQEYKNKRIVISTKDGRPLRFQTPKLYVPFGCTSFTPDIGDKKCSLDMSLNGWDEEGGFIQKFYRCLRKIEDQVIDNVYEQRQEIFNRDISRDELETMFNSNVREAMNGHAPKFRCKVDLNAQGQIKCDVFDAKKERLRDEITEGLYSKCTVKAICELASVYFMNRKFGCVWRLNQLMTFEIERPKGFLFDSLLSQAAQPDEACSGCAS